MLHSACGVRFVCGGVRWLQVLLCVLLGGRAWHSNTMQLKRSHAPSAVAQRKKLKEGDDSSDPESTGGSASGPLMPGHNKSALEEFLGHLHRCAGAASRADDREDDAMEEDGADDESNKENATTTSGGSSSSSSGGEELFYAVSYSQRTGSRRGETDSTPDAVGEGTSPRHSTSFVDDVDAYSPGECDVESGLLILEMDERRVRLLNLEAKDIGKATVKNLLKFVERNVPMMIGNKEIQVCSLHSPVPLLLVTSRRENAHLLVWCVL